LSKLKNNVGKAKRKRRQRTGDPLVAKFPLRLTPDQVTIARTLQMEAAKVWNRGTRPEGGSCFIHRLIYAAYHIWLGEAAMKDFVKGRFKIHSQSVQAIV
jgi:putative transposase